MYIFKLVAVIKYTDTCIHYMWYPWSWLVMTASKWLCGGKKQVNIHFESSSHSQQNVYLKIIGGEEGNDVQGEIHGLTREDTKVL